MLEERIVWEVITPAGPGQRGPCASVLFDNKERAVEYAEKHGPRPVLLVCRTIQIEPIHAEVWRDLEE